MDNGEFRTKDFPFQLTDTKALAESGEFSGYASVFGNIDSYGDIVMPGAFNADLDWFMENGAICWQHNWNDPIGKPIEAHEDSVGLFVRGTIVDTRVGEDVRKLMLGGVIKKLSIGFHTVEDEAITPANIISFLGGDLDPDELEGAVLWGRALKRLKVYDVSPVTIPANELAAIVAVKSNLPAGYKFAEHTDAVRDAVEDFAVRVRKVTTLRLKEGRELSTENHNRLLAAHDSIITAVSELKSLLDKCAPKDKEQGEAIKHLVADLQRTRLALNGIGLGELK